MEDINRALITKLVWSVCEDGPKPWVQLIKTRYLRGGKVLDVQGTERAVSWIFGEVSNNAYPPFALGHATKLQPTQP